MSVSALRAYRHRDLFRLVIKYEGTESHSFQVIVNVIEVILSQMFGYSILRYRQLHQSGLRSMQPSRHRRFPCPVHVWP